MKKIILVLTMLLILGLHSCSASLPPGFVAGTVTRVWDGDTVTLELEEPTNIKLPNKQEAVSLPRSLRIRLAGIDAPEHDQYLGRQATNALRYLVLHKAVKVQIFEQDKYHRHIARLYLPYTTEFPPPPSSAVYDPGRDVGLEMLQKGMAWHYTYFDTHNPNYAAYTQAEEEAKRNHLGVWSESYPTAPWDYRQRKN